MTDNYTLSSGSKLVFYRNLTQFRIVSLTKNWYLFPPKSVSNDPESKKEICFQNHSQTRCPKKHEPVFLLMSFCLSFQNNISTTFCGANSIHQFNINPDRHTNIRTVYTNHHNATMIIYWTQSLIMIFIYQWVYRHSLIFYSWKQNPVPIF